MWFIGLEFNKLLAKNVDFTPEIRTFNEMIESMRVGSRGPLMYNESMQVSQSHCSIACIIFG